MSGIDTELVDVLVPLGPDKVELAVAAESAPLRVDDHVLLAGEVLRVDGADGRYLLQVAGVGAGAEDEPDAAVGLLSVTVSVCYCSF